MTTMGAGRAAGDPTLLNRAVLNDIGMAIGADYLAASHSPVEDAIKIFGEKTLRRNDRLEDVTLVITVMVNGADWDAGKVNLEILQDMLETEFARAELEQTGKCTLRGVEIQTPASPPMPELFGSW